ncbi:MAG: amidohydrolase family protein [Gemmataceae bacterium]
MLRTLSTLALLAVAVPAAAEEVVVRAAKVYTAAGDPLAPGAVRIKDGKIAEVAKEIAAPAGAKVIDLGQGCLIPGLIDAHSTAGLTDDAEFTEEITPNFRVLDAVDWKARAFKVSLADGATTYGLVPGTDNVIGGLGSVVKPSAAPANRVVKKDHTLAIVVASDPASRNSSRNRPDSIYVRQPTNRMGVVWMLRNDFLRAKSASESDVVRQSLDGKRPIVCVSRIDSDILSALRLQKDYGYPLVLAGGQEAYKVTGEIAAAKVPVLLGPLPMALSFNGPEGSDPIWNQPAILKKAGIPFAFTGGNLLTQARFAVRFGLSPTDALAAVTASPAKILGVENRIGSIAPGRDADLVALSADPFDLTAAVLWTMTDGATRFEGR